jgi:hypothetical protein
LDLTPFNRGCKAAPVEAPEEGFWPSMVVVGCDWRCGSGVVSAADFDGSLVGFCQQWGFQSLNVCNFKWRC